MEAGFAKVRCLTPEVQLGLGQELIFVDHSSHGHFAVAIVNAYDFSFAADADAFGQGDFGRKGQSEFDN